MFGAYAEGTIVGMAGLRRQVGQKDSHKAYVWGMYVQPDCRGTGIGSALLHELILVSKPSSSNSPYQSSKATIPPPLSIEKLDSKSTASSHAP